MCFYGIALWSNYSVTTLLRLEYCYQKCIKMFFGYPKYHSITAMLLDLKQPCFDAVVHNFRQATDGSTRFVTTPATSPRRYGDQLFFVAMAQE